MTATNTRLPVQVQSVMQRHPATIHDYQTVQDAVEIMTERHVSALPVVDDGNYLKGILTISDLLRVVQDAERTLDSDLAIYDQSFVVADMIRETLGTDEVASVMSGVLFTVTQEDKLKDAAKLMIEHQVHHVLVTSKDMRLLGILSAIDFVRQAAESPE
jgi:CBS domain-containing protein